MKRTVFGESVQGASHLRIEMECQDSKKKSEIDDETVILAVADGHGSRSSPYSRSGSKIAVNVFCDVLSKLYDENKDNLESLLTYLNREGVITIGKTIDAEWERRVLKAHTKHKRDVPQTMNGKNEKESILRQYGSTIVGLMITSIFVFAFQLGDGDISYIDNDVVVNLLQQDRILGTETHSLCNVDSWKKATSAVYRRKVSEKLPSMFILSSDGFYNSHQNDDEFNKTCIDYFQMIKHYGPPLVSKNLKGWLTETSEQGCGDDITLLIAFYNTEDGSLPKVDGSI